MAGMNDILRHVDDLPAFPAVVARAASMLTSPDSTLADVERIVKQDEALAAAVLKRGNSARFGAAGRTFNLHQSLGRIGRAAAMELIMNMKLSSFMERGGEAYGLRRRALWQGSLFGAIAAEQIARGIGKADPGVAYLCGLMRDVGKLAIDCYCMHHRPDLFTLSSTEPRPFIDCERQALGVDHSEVGAALAERWELPAPVAEAIRFHHEPPSFDDPRHSDLFDIVHAADILCLGTGLGVGNDGLRYRLATHVRQAILPTHHAAAEYTAASWAEFIAIDPAASAPATAAARPARETTA
jgi:HD-like signal output (HDOD) protein